MAAVGKYVVEDTSEREDVHSALDTLRDRVGGGRGVARIACRAASVHVSWLRDQLRGLPPNSTRVARRANESAHVVWQCLTETEVRYHQTRGFVLGSLWVGDEDVLRLDIAMDDPQTVEVVQAVGQLIQGAWNIPVDLIDKTPLSISKILARPAISEEVKETGLAHLDSDV